MEYYGGDVRALFLSPDGNIYPDTLICSGVVPPELDGKPCPYSDMGRMPGVITLDPTASNYVIDKGQPGDLCPPCGKQQLASLQHWQGHGRQQFPDELLPLRLFKCRQWFWLVVPGLCDSDPTTISRNGSKP